MKKMYRVKYVLSKKKRRFMNVFASSVEEARRKVLSEINRKQQAANLYENVDSVEVVKCKQP